MDKKKIRYTVFAVMVLIQLAVPAKMIYDSEVVMHSGSEFRFRTAPVDPIDPFRGKYITLNFSDNTVEVEDSKEWKMGQSAYAVLKTDAEGYAQIAALHKKKPKNADHYIKVFVDYASYNNENMLHVKYPFDRYYMEESKAQAAEDSYRIAHQEQKQNTYTLVSVKDGEAVLLDVMVDGRPIRELVEEQVLLPLQD